MSMASPNVSDAQIAKGLTFNEAGRIASNIAKLHPYVMAGL